ncbi:UNVERIFIED_CONTAM: hypothetical protein FKN15_033089 [Acipenser sinensis]
MSGDASALSDDIGMLALKYIKVEEMAKKVVPKGAPTAQHIANVMETSDHLNKTRATLLNQECIGLFDLATHGMGSEDKVDVYMKRWHEHQRELKEGGATRCLICLEYGHLPEVCPYEDPLFVQAFDRGEVETAEEWIHLKAIPSPPVDQETCLTCLKGEEWCFAVGKVGHKPPDQPPPWQEVELLVPKKGRRGGAKKAKKQAPAPEGEPVHPAPGRWEPVHPTPMKVEPERQEPKRGKLKMVEASSWCPSCRKGGNSVVNCPRPGEEEEG